MIVEVTRHGAAWRMVDPGGRIGSFLADGRPYEAPLLDEIADRGLDGSALDIGAHVGNHSLYLAAVCGLKVYAFEPNPTTYEALVENLMLNPTLDVVPFLCAAGAHSAKGRIDRAMVVTEDAAGTIDVLRVDDLLPYADDVSVVKVDVEGMEHDALAGAAALLARCTPLVYAETHTRAAGRRIAAVLEPIGYAATGAVRMGSTMERWECAA